MIIDGRDLVNRDLFHNIVDCKQTEHGISFSRFSDTQLSVYAKNEIFRIRSLLASGVCLDLVTTSNHIKLVFEIKETARDYAFFDLYIDECFVESKGCEPAAEIGNSIDFDLGNAYMKKQKITIYLPHLVVLYIKRIELDDGSFIEGVPKPSKTLLCLGDSITQGMVAKRPSSAYPVQLSRKLKMGLLNQGIAGYLFNSDVMDYMLQDKPDIITIAYGVNDWNKYSSQSLFEEKCNKFMEKLTRLYPVSKKVIILPVWKHNVQEIRGIGTLKDVSLMIREICRRYDGLVIIDGMKLIPHMSSYYADGVHPNDEGFIHYSLNLICEIIG